MPKAHANAKEKDEEDGAENRSKPPIILCWQVTAIGIYWAGCICEWCDYPHDSQLHAQQQGEFLDGNSGDSAPINRMTGSNAVVYASTLPKTSWATKNNTSRMIIARWGERPCICVAMPSANHFTKPTRLSPSQSAIDAPSQANVRNRRSQDGTPHFAELMQTLDCRSFGALS